MASLAMFRNLGLYSQHDEDPLEENIMPIHCEEWTKGQD
jgi:hypothetical protein